ncbi:carboxylesterase family protein [Streptomyces sp. PanSC9]|nr:carboxylesterase family protein [Streptomyces sp. PanSC9]
MPGGSTDEDCLHLNVTTPDGARPERPRPVVVWLHGGGFTTGTGSSYDAHRMATRGGVVVVTVNYRLGALGFLAHRGLPGSGTFGLADQQAALRWVRAEIGAFGGDAHDVTLAGESAGGYSVCAQLASPAAAGLFDRAIIESGPCTGRPDRPFAPSSVPLSTARATGAEPAARAGCGSARDVMAITAPNPTSRPWRTHRSATRCTRCSPWRCSWSTASAAVPPAARAGATRRSADGRLRAR